MAFPGTYNINYYKGDTYEFRVYPKDSLGGAFPLSQFISPNGVTKFTIAPERGSASRIIEGFAQISNDQTNILCTITPSNGASMTAGTSYVYDIEIARSSADYDYVYTLLTGNIAVLEQVTQPGELNLPNNPTGLTLVGLTTNSISISWTAPTEGGTVDGYKLYIIPYTVDPGTILAGLSGEPEDTVTASTTSYTFTGLDDATGYLVAVRSYNAVGDADIATVLSNLLAGPITTLPEVS
jgi:chitinase